jgi:hypothetical protein
LKSLVSLEVKDANDPESSNKTLVVSVTALNNDKADDKLWVISGRVMRHGTWPKITGVISYRSGKWVSLLTVQDQVKK